MILAMVTSLNIVVAGVCFVTAVHFFKEGLRGSAAWMISMTWLNVFAALL